jgi:hypothetical protein
MGKKKDKALTLEQFRQKYNWAPYELHEFAQGAEDIVDCERLALAASKYLYWREQFKCLLEEHEIEVG